MNIDDIKYIVGMKLENIKENSYNRIVHIDFQNLYTPLHDNSCCIIAYCNSDNFIVKVAQGNKFYELEKDEDVIISNLNVILSDYGFILSKRYNRNACYVLEDTKKQHRLYTYNELSHFHLEYFEKILLDIIEKEIDKLEPAIV